MYFFTSVIEILKILVILKTLIDLWKIFKILSDLLSPLINYVRKSRENFLDPLPTARLFGGEVVEDQLIRILEYLADKNIGKLGVYGMGGVGKTTIMRHVDNRLKDDKLGGVGKTTIMRHVNNRLKEDKLFNSIIWVTVSKEDNLRRLQSDVAAAINLELSDERNEEIRSKELSEGFSKRKKFLLILDDVWKKFPLKDIGIPEPNKENGVKIVLTTRSLQVCVDMKTQKNIEVDALTKDYAWDLFTSKVENVVLSDPEIVKRAKLVAEECKGLPLALINVGRALRNANDVRLWENALDELRGSTHDTRGMDDDVFKQLKFSYTHLRSEDNLRECFLYCSLYPENCIIDKKKLIELWMWEGLIKEDTGTAGMIYKQGDDIINELINTCMLESVHVKDDVDEVKMHDLTRDMAIRITRDPPRFMVETGVGLKKQPKNKEFVKDIERISLSRNAIASLVGQPNCPKLRTLFLDDNNGLSRISSSFFSNMDSLRVLDLSRTNIKELPNSLSDLVNLRALFLPGCWRLVDLPSLAKLKELRILNLSSTGITQLPPGMEGLIKLRYLDLSNTDHLKSIRVGILLQLSALEELSLIRSLWKFDSTNREAGTIINEISGLKRLDKLSINFKDMQSFVNFHELHPWKSLHKFVSLIGPTKEREKDDFRKCGSVWMWNDDNCCSVLDFDDYYLQIKQCWCNLVIPPVLNDTGTFKSYEISGCNCTEYIFRGRKDSSLSTIEELRVRYMWNLKAISKGVMPYGALANIRALYIFRCQALEYVFTASIRKEFAVLCRRKHHGMLQSLRILDVRYCDTLKTLFSSDLLQNLQNIEEIVIRKCGSMEQMVVEGADGEDTCEVENISENAISLPRLQVLRLEGLDNLKGICKRMLICNSLQQIKLFYCPQFSSLPLSIKNPTATLDGCIEGSRDWWNALHWKDPNTKTILQPLFREKPFDPTYYFEDEPNP